MQKNVPSPQRIMDLASAFYGSCVLFTASDVGVFGALARQPGLTSDALATELALDARAVRLLADACAALGLLDKADGGYVNSPESAAFLVPGAPGDLSRAIRYNRDVYAAWGRLSGFARTGEPVERPEAHLGDDPARTRDFVLSMHGRAMAIGRAVVPLLAIPEGARVLDVGGGPAAYSMLIARAVPGAVCTVIDLPGVAAIAAELVTEAGLTDRVRCVGGNYHSTPFPPDQDTVVMLGILHQESPAGIGALLKKARAALKPGGRIYVLDMMTDGTRANPPFSALFAVNMALTARHGWVFSDDDLSGWLAEAGFRDFVCAPLPPPMPHWLATARV